MQRGCIQCGECLNVCPVYREFNREEYSPKGKRMLAEPVENAPANGAPELSWKRVFSLARLCAGCGRCRLACGRNLSTADLLADVRSANPHWSQFMWEQWITRLGPLWPALGRLALMAPESLAPSSLRPMLANARVMAGAKPPYPWAVIRKAPEAPAATTRPVVVFSGCTARNIRPAWTAGAEGLLRAWGYTVLDGGRFTCCGGTMHHAGRYEVMRDMRERNIAQWRTMGNPLLAVFCASCFRSLADYAGDDSLPGDLRAAWQSSLAPLTSLLCDPRGEPLSGKPSDYGYHQPCHWDARDPDLPWLQRVLPGLRTGSGLCCGMGGILKITDPGLSAGIARSCLAGFPRGLSAILTGCSGCAVQLASYTDTETAVFHWLDVLRPAV